MPQADLGRLLNSIGMSTFVRYYEEFSDPLLSTQDVVDVLPSQYTMNSRITRATKARKIFREGLELDALWLVLHSSRVGADTSNQARVLLDNRSAGQTCTSTSTVELETKLQRVQRRIEHLQTELAKRHEELRKP